MTLRKGLAHLDVGDPGPLLEPVLVEQLHSFQGVHGLDETDVLGELKCEETSRSWVRIPDHILLRVTTPAF
jgi:hypothetical protein